MACFSSADSACTYDSMLHNFCIFANPQDAPPHLCLFQAFSVSPRLRILLQPFSHKSCRARVAPLAVGASSHHSRPHGTPVVCM